MESSTIKSIEGLNAAIDELRKDGIDDIFIVAALAQILGDLTDIHD